MLNILTSFLIILGVTIGGAGIIKYNESQVQALEGEMNRLGASQKISALTTGTSLDDADVIPYVDNSGTPTTTLSSCDR